MFNKEVGGIIHYHCAMKAELKCNAKAKVKVVEDPTDFILNEIDKSHNHDSLEGPVVAETIQNEMKQEFEKDFRRNPNDIKKKVMNKFKQSTVVLLQVIMLRIVFANICLLTVLSVKT